MTAANLFLALSGVFMKFVVTQTLTKSTQSLEMRTMILIDRKVGTEIEIL